MSVKQPSSNKRYILLPLSAGIIGCNTFQALFRADSEVLFNRQQKYTAAR